MQKTFVTLIYSLALLISFSISAQSSSLHIWNDEVEMRPYLTAIQFISQKLESHIEAEKAENGDIDNCFVSFPSPNSFYKRTPRYLYLETFVYGNNNEQIYMLWTPFGQLNLLDSALKKNRLTCTISFLQKMKSHWHLQNVTNTARNYIYSTNWKQKEYIDGPYPYRPQPWENIYVKTHLYLIKEINGHVFVNEDEKDLSLNKLMIYSFAHLKFDQEEKDRNLFLRLSQGLSKL